jgi:hypothetical protein
MLLNYTYHSRFLYLWPAPALFLAHGRRAPRPPPPSPARHQAQLGLAPTGAEPRALLRPLYFRPTGAGPRALRRQARGPSSPHTARFSFWPEPTAPTRQTPDTGRPRRLRFALPTQNRGVPLVLASRPLADTASRVQSIGRGFNAHLS